MNNNEILLDVIGELDEALIPELSVKPKRNTAIRRSMIGGGICAAALIGAIFLLPETGGHKLPSQTSPTPSESNTQEVAQTEASIATEVQRETETAVPTEAETVNGKVKLSSAISFAGGGFEGLMAYDISELATANPWSADLHIETLPVYRNLAYAKEYPQLSGMACLTEERMQEIAQGIADGMGTTLTSTKTVLIGEIAGGTLPQTIKAMPSRLDAVLENGYSLSVHGNGNVQINCIRNPLQLVTGKDFTISSTSKEQALAAFDRLSEEFSAILGFENPVGYTYADRSFEGEENRSYYLYDKSDDPIQDILNFNLSYATFSPTDIIWITNAMHTAEYLDDYPIITADEAEALLLDGGYHTTVPEEYLRSGAVRQEDIARTELVYRNVKREEFHQPYYRFYVELDPSAFFNAPEGLKNYGIFYVPAVKSEYLTDFSTELSFN